MEGAEVRPAHPSDAERLTEIYNHYVLNAHYSFDLDPMSVAERRIWMEHYGARGRHQLLVAARQGHVVAYVSSSPFRPKAAYLTSVETSIYVDPGFTGQGIGSRLYQELFQRLEAEDVHRAYAGIALPNPASEALHLKAGFVKVAHFTEQGRKFGRFWDVVWYERAV